MYIYAETINNSDLPGRVVSQNLNQSPYNNDLQVVSAHVAIHEIGHSFRAGENDDSETLPLPLGEVYSGEPGVDDTPESLPGTSDEWSIMRQGWDQDAAFEHTVTTNRRSFQRMYYPFSIEETITIQEP
jgi:hypothetical protein